MSILFLSSCLKGTPGEPGPVGEPGPAGIDSTIEFSDILNECLTMPNALALPNTGGTLSNCVCLTPILHTYSDSLCSTENMSTILAAFHLPTCSINDFYLTAHVIDVSAAYVKLTCS